MSSSTSLFRSSQTPAAVFHKAPNYNNYISQRRTDYTSQHTPTLPHPAPERSAVGLVHGAQPTDVIAPAPRSNSCMQLNYHPATTVFPPQNEWEGQVHHNTAPGWHTPASEIPRSVQSAFPNAQQSWSMQSSGQESNSMGFVGTSQLDDFKREHTHQRASSTSTIASNGPASPYTFSTAHPQVADISAPPFDASFELAKDSFAPHASHTDPAYLSANYIPSHLARINSTQRFYNFTQGYSMSNADSTAPSTPSSISDESNARSRGTHRANGDGVPSGSQQADVEHRAVHPSVQLSRTESAAYQDELYNPADFGTPAAAVKPSRPQVATATPASRTLVNQYLESANMARSASPRSAVSRERSPFREGSELAQSEAWNSPKNPTQTAASRRQQMKLEREQAELAAHRPQLQREPTKTISPKDALLDYNEDHPPLIQDVVPAGYKQHFGGSEPYTNTSSATALRNASFTVPTSSNPDKNNMAGFRASSGDAFTTTNFNFSPPNSQNTAAMQNPFQMGAYQHLGQLDPSYAAVTLAEPTPQFPATLTSMESSISDQTPALSSQDSNIIPRPSDTRANAGTYTCTFHGCAQRFDSPALLQRHKREFHRSQQQQQQQQVVREALSVEASSESPRSTASPGPAGSGLTSAQILARNSQAGPHKCTRTNPSTGKPCNTVFSRPYDLTRHEDTIHNGRKHKVRCPYCREEKTFSRNDALTRHMRVVHPDVENFGKRGRRSD